MARILDAVIGHGNLLSTLLKSVEEDRLGQTLLFSGPSGVGKKMIALGLTQALFCERTRLACGSCGPCMRVEHVQSESLLYIASSASSATAQIKMEQSQQILEFLSLQKIGRARMVIIDQAHQLNSQAANALLKILEEPPPQSFFILLSSNANALLPTIRSRSQQISFSPLTNEQVKSLTKADDWIVRAARGSAELAMQLAESEGEWTELRNRSISVWQLVQQGQLGESFGLVRELSRDRAQATFVAQTWQRVIRDLFILKIGEGQNGLLNPDKFDELKTMTSLSPASLSTLAKHSLAVEQDINRNIDRSLSMENFWFELRDAYAVERGAANAMD